MRTYFLAGWMAGCLWAAAGTGRAAEPAAVVDLGLHLHESETLAVEGIKKVVVSNSEVVEVVPVTLSELVINAKKQGVSYVTLFEEKRRRTVRVVVTPNTAAILGAVRNALNLPGVKVTVAGENFVLQGEVATQDERNEAVTIVSAFLPQLRPAGPPAGTVNNVVNETRYPKADDTSEGDVADAQPYASPTPSGIVDLLRVRNQRQVRLAVQVVRINRANLKDFGLKFANELSYGIGILAGQSRRQGSDEAFGDPGSSTRAGSEGNARGYALGYGTLGQETFEVGDDTVSVGYSVALRTLESKGLAKTLASPVITTLDGAEASFLAGGKVILNQSGFVNGTYTTTTQTEEIGVKVFFRPKIMRNGRIGLFVTPKVSDLPVEFANGSFLITSRNTRNNVEMRSGDTMVLSGLFAIDSKANVNQFPWLADIPILGELFKNRANDVQNQEVVFFVTPEIVNTPADAAVGDDLRTRMPETEEMLREHGVLGPAPGGKALATPARRMNLRTATPASETPAEVRSLFQSGSRADQPGLRMRPGGRETQP